MILDKEVESQKCGLEEVCGGGGDDCSHNRDSECNKRLCYKRTLCGTDWGERVGIEVTGDRDSTRA